MRYLIVCILSSILAAGNAFAQNVNDDSVQYTPIPLPETKNTKKSMHVQVSKADRAVSYFFAAQSGSLIGCHDCGDATGISSTTSIVNGITMGRKLRTGIGLGFDSYTGWQTVPAFLSLGYDLVGNKSKNAFFVQMNYGLAKAWLKESFRGFNFQRSEGGRMFSPQLGYRIKYHELNISFTAGVKFQRVFAHYSYPYWDWSSSDRRPGTNSSAIRQDMTRVTIAMSIGF